MTRYAKVDYSLIARTVKMMATRRGEEVRLTDAVSDVCKATGLNIDTKRVMSKLGNRVQERVIETADARQVVTYVLPMKASA